MPAPAGEPKGRQVAASHPIMLSPPRVTRTPPLPPTPSKTLSHFPSSNLAPKHCCCSGAGFPDGFHYHQDAAAASKQHPQPQLTSPQRGSAMAVPSPPQPH